jgi:hypothetical protein
VSVLRPKDGDYIGRGIILLWVWTVFGWMPAALLGAVLAGAFGATVGFAVAFPLGILLYGPYLKLDPAEQRRKKSLR